jgi:hypothetical protein
MVYLFLWFNLRGTMKINHIGGVKVFVGLATFEIGPLAFYANTVFRIRICCPADVFCL